MSSVLLNMSLRGMIQIFFTGLQTLILLLLIVIQKMVFSPHDRTVSFDHDGVHYSSSQFYKLFKLPNYSTTSTLGKGLSVACVSWCLLQGRLNWVSLSCGL